MHPKWTAWSVGTILAGLLAALTIRNPRRAEAPAAEPAAAFHCSLDAPPPSPIVALQPATVPGADHGSRPG